MDSQELKKEIAELDSKAETLVAQLNETLQLIKLKREMLHRVESDEMVIAGTAAMPQYRTAD